MFFAFALGVGVVVFFSQSCVHFARQSHIISFSPTVRNGLQLRRAMRIAHLLSLVCQSNRPGNKTIYCRNYMK